MPDFEIENTYNGLIAGVDEAGRGPWVGPVVAGAVVFLKTPIHPHLAKHLDDSKKLSKKRREELYALIKEEAEKKNLTYGIGLASAKEIDELNILQATFLAMSRAVSNLEVKPNMALIDGNRTPKEFSCLNRCVIKGDSKSYSIAGASVVAKVYRDNLMKEMALKYPYYGFEKNAGYGTKEHIEALKKFGICPEHRKTYKPVMALLCAKK
ncbi:MAG: ribonuclease HII [Alphaproteobacteria bacterium]|nr:ribonuclease HII [Alphaproteobacteria bacterium]